MPIHIELVSYTLLANTHQKLRLLWAKHYSTQNNEPLVCITHLVTLEIEIQAQTKHLDTMFNLLYLRFQGDLWRHDPRRTEVWLAEPCSMLDSVVEESTASPLASGSGRTVCRPILFIVRDDVPLQHEHTEP